MSEGQSKHIIYAHKDPRNCMTRYVGRTNDGYRRFWEHIGGMFQPGNTRKNAWMREVKQAGQMIIQEELDFAQTEAEACMKEAYWIHYYRSLPGVLPLLNKSIPPLLCKSPTPGIPGMIEFDTTYDQLGGLIKIITNDQSVFSERNGRDLGVASLCFYPDIWQAQVSLYVCQPRTWEFLVLHWIRELLRDRRFFASYRYKLDECTEWATFGDRSFVERRETTPTCERWYGDVFLEQEWKIRWSTLYDEERKSRRDRNIRSWYECMRGPDCLPIQR